MATVSKGRTFVSGETVTPAKLNELVDNATVTAIQTADIADGQITTAKIADANVTTAKIADANVTTAKIADANVTTAKLAAVTAQALLPAGAVMPFARATAPAGWLIANGDVVPNGSGTVQGVTADFSALHAALSTSFGTAGALPDLRGIFVRGSGSQTISGTTYSGTFAAKQSDLLKDHRHLPDVSNRFFNYRANTSGFAPTYNSGQVVSDDLFGTATGYVADSLGGTETRPANIALLYCIKF